ncbi:hypothetical protein N9N28_14205 [Rubripirellula amarantea]|uniref:Uncharacterized protein n=1 Tax=Rubripirellula amarantea TaxID=2527999 RepID=A0A5C5WY59_9BACT|nr:hypothetical protein [Rubripirellula amarantea]MDA8745781.1 hypothetical protein [Rubripirellula amarantea]TWT54832.1 hypothetical protein Pla22_24860 [Rubripirellula amarantea]
MQPSPVQSLVVDSSPRLLNQIFQSLAKVSNTIAKAEMLTRETGVASPPMEGIGIVSTETQNSIEA